MRQEKVTARKAVALGALVLHEEVSWNQLVGAAIVIGGIILAQSGSASPQDAPEQGLKELA
jgi:drug/metabolite transporter (DMT)-like permease